MKLEINQTEIKEAITDWIAKQGIPLENKTITVDLRAGRGENGPTASINIECKAPQSANESSTPAEETTDTEAPTNEAEITVPIMDGIEDAKETESLFS